MFPYRDTRPWTHTFKKKMEGTKTRKSNMQMRGGGDNMRDTVKRDIKKKNTHSDRKDAETTLRNNYSFFKKVGWDGKSKFLPIILGVYPFVFFVLS